MDAPMLCVEEMPESVIRKSQPEVAIITGSTSIVELPLAAYRKTG